MKNNKHLKKIGFGLTLLLLAFIAQKTLFDSYYKKQITVSIPANIKQASGLVFQSNLIELDLSKNYLTIDQAKILTSSSATPLFSFEKISGHFENHKNILMIDKLDAKGLSLPFFESEVTLPQVNIFKFQDDIFEYDLLLEEISSNIQKQLVVHEFYLNDYIKKLSSPENLSESQLAKIKERAQEQLEKELDFTPPNPLQVKESVDINRLAIELLRPLIEGQLFNFDQVLRKIKTAQLQLENESLIKPLLDLKKLFFLEKGDLVGEFTNLTTYSHQKQQAPFSFQFQGDFEKYQVKGVKIKGESHTGKNNAFVIMGDILELPLDFGFVHGVAKLNVSAFSINNQVSIKMNFDIQNLKYREESESDWEQLFEEVFPEDSMVLNIIYNRFEEDEPLTIEKMQLDLAHEIVEIDIHERLLHYFSETVIQNAISQVETSEILQKRQDLRSELSQVLNQ